MILSKSTRKAISYSRFPNLSNNIDLQLIVFDFSPYYIFQ
ncbi:hypothetical protein LINPERPRIM_LOCUS33348 [Linum perenne]